MQSSSQPTEVNEITVKIARSSFGVEAIYIKLREGKSHHSIPVGSNSEGVLDFNTKDELIGIELLEPGQLTVREVKKISKKYNVPDLLRLSEAYAV